MKAPIPAVMLPRGDAPRKNEAVVHSFSDGTVPVIVRVHTVAGEPFRMTVQHGEAVRKKIERVTQCGLLHPANELVEVGDRAARWSRRCHNNDVNTGDCSETIKILADRRPDIVSTTGK